MLIMAETLSVLSKTKVAEIVTFQITESRHIKLRCLPPICHFAVPLNFAKIFLVHLNGLLPVFIICCYNFTAY